MTQPRWHRAQRRSISRMSWTSAHCTAPTRPRLGLLRRRQQLSWRRLTSTRATAGWDPHMLKYTRHRKQAVTCPWLLPLALSGMGNSPCLRRPISSSTGSGSADTRRTHRRRLRRQRLLHGRGCRRVGSLRGGSGEQGESVLALLSSYDRKWMYCRLHLANLSALLVLLSHEVIKMCYVC
jgi:hypothetical protein